MDTRITAWPLKSARQWAAALLLPTSLAFTSPAAAREKRHQFDIGSTSLSLAIIEVGRQSSTPVATLISDLPLIRTPAVRGTMKVDQALKLLLAGTGFRHRKTSNGTYMIERARQARAPKKPPTTNASKAPRLNAAEDEHDFVDPDIIIVTASKNDTPLSDYAGGAYVTAVNEDQIRAGAGRGSDAMVELLPMLASSSMGPGRNKIYGRAVSDGSFNGFMQSNLGIYLGEQRLGYSAPDPNLQLFDVDRVEVLLGPHGTLYGSGALGGVLRIQPTAPKLADREAAILAEITTVTQGGSGSTISAMVNQPLVTDRIALRAVAYQIFEPGYLDHVPEFDDTPSITTKNSNSITIRGARAAMRWEWDDSSQLDFGFAYQRIAGRDISHTGIAPPRLEIDAPMLQPYSNDFMMRSLTYRKQWDDWTLTSVSGWINQRTNELFYQVSYNGSVGYLTADRDIFILSHETRATADLGRWNLIMGFSTLKNQSVTIDKNIGLDLGYDYNRTSKITTHENALFGEVRRELGGNVTAMLGARLARVHEDISIKPLNLDERGDHSIQKRWDFLPSASLSWKPGTGHLIFAAYREGFRSSGMFPPAFLGLTGGFEIPPKPDKIRMIETGYRFSGSSKFSLTMNGYYIHWYSRNTDSIIFLVGGFAPNNTGDVKIWGGDAIVNWKVSSRFRINSGIAVNNLPNYTPPKPSFYPDWYIMAPQHLPNIPQITARLGMQYNIPLDHQWDLNLSGAIRYRGKVYGEYNDPIKPREEIGAEVRITNGEYAFWFKVSNILNNTNNSFDGGNPFYYTAQNREVYTPNPPRSFALGASKRF